MISRRSLVTGLVGFLAAPAIVRASSIMSVKVVLPPAAGLPLEMPEYQRWAQSFLEVRGIHIDTGEPAVYRLERQEENDVLVVRVPAGFVIRDISVPG